MLFFNIQGKVPVVIEWLKRVVKGIENISELCFSTETEISFVFSNFKIFMVS